MRILILTCATGGGHLRAAAALEKYIRETTTHEVIQMDFLKSILFYGRLPCVSLYRDKTGHDQNSLRSLYHYILQKERGTQKDRWLSLCVLRTV